MDNQGEPRSVVNPGRDGLADESDEPEDVVVGRLGVDDVKRLMMGDPVAQSSVRLDGLIYLVPVSSAVREGVTYRLLPQGPLIGRLEQIRPEAELCRRDDVVGTDDRAPVAPRLRDIFLRVGDLLMSPGAHVPIDRGIYPGQSRMP